MVKKIISLSKQKNYYNKKSKIVFIKDRPGHDLRYALNSKKIKKKLGWSTTININKGLSSTLEWFNNNKKFYTLIKNKNFANRLGKNR